MPSLPAVAPNLLDRLVGWFAPVAGARRMHARMVMALASGRVTPVRRQSGGHDGTMENWRPRREQEEMSATRAYDVIMRRAESLVANDGHAASAIDALALNVVGTGMRPQSYPDHVALGITEDQAEVFAESMETAWRLWCEEADASSRSSFEDLQYLAARSLFVTGEILQLPVWRDAPDRVFGLCLQALHPARLRTPHRSFFPVRHLQRCPVGPLRGACGLLDRQSRDRYPSGIPGFVALFLCPAQGGAPLGLFPLFPCRPARTGPRCLAAVAGHEAVP